MSKFFVQVTKENGEVCFFDLADFLKCCVDAAQAKANADVGLHDDLEPDDVQPSEEVEP